MMSRSVTHSIMSPQICPHPNIGMLNIFALHSKRDFVDMTKLKILRLKGYSEFPRWARVITKGLGRGR